MELMLEPPVVGAWVTGSMAMNTLRHRNHESDAIPPEALAYSDDVTKEAVESLRDKASDALKKGEWRVYEGARNGKTT
ncbi:MAG: hypothetical protein ACKVP5_18040 [Aestuariivirga sp.]